MFSFHPLDYSRKSSTTAVLQFGFDIPIRGFTSIRKVQSRNNIYSPEPFQETYFFLFSLYVTCIFYIVFHCMWGMELDRLLRSLHSKNMCTSNTASLPFEYELDRLIDGKRRIGCQKLN